MKLRILEFQQEHAEQAAALALVCYEEERAHVPALPRIAQAPDLGEFAGSPFGVAALEGERMVGFLCFYPPWENAFTTTARGSFSPIHAHGAVRENRERIYQRMYQAVAQRLVRDGATSHSVGLYAHDREGERAFFTLGFGMRCVDAIRYADGGEESAPELRELRREETPLVRELRRGLSLHLGESPCFMVASPESFAGWLSAAEARNTRLFAAFEKGRAIGFYEVTENGENFVTEQADMKNICGAYCLPEYRGTGIMERLLKHVLSVLHREGVARLGVDYESINATALAFWGKHFIPYTQGLVRRIDESALTEAQDMIE